MGLKRTLGSSLAVPARAYVRHVPSTLGKRILVRRLLEPALRGAPRRFVARTVDGFTMAGTTDDLIQRYVYVFGVWEPSVTAWIRRRLTPGRTLLDVGANVGYFTLLGSRLVGPRGHVVAVEALPATFQQLQENIARNGATNVRAVNIAATSVRGTVSLYGGDAHNSGTTSTIQADGMHELTSVDGIPLRHVLTADEIESTRLVKIDVEGAEFDVLQGLGPVLSQMPADVELIVEVSPDDELAAGRRPEAPLDLLAEHGFVPYLIRNDYAPVSYLHAPAPPERFHGPLTERIDLVFSRTDTDVLP